MGIRCKLGVHNWRWDGPIDGAMNNIRFCRSCGEMQRTGWGPELWFTERVNTVDEYQQLLQQANVYKQSKRDRETSLKNERKKAMQKMNS